MAYSIGLQSAQLTNFEVTIDGVKLTLGQVNSIKMKWDILNFRVTGKLLFKDLSNLVKGLPIRGGNEITMAMTDFDNIASKQKFKIVDVSTTRTVSGEPLTLLTFVDPVTYTAMKMYKGMSWSEATALDIINHEETLKPLLEDKEQDFAKDLKKFKNWVMPLHVSFNVVMNWLAKKSNKFWFQTREKYIFQSVDVLFGKEKKGDIYRYKTPNEHYRRRIFQHDAQFGRVLQADMFQPKAKIAYMDSETKEQKWVEKDFKTAEKEINSSGNKEQEIDETIGERQIYKSSTNIEDTSSNMWVTNTFESIVLHILVPGQFATNIGDMVELDLVNYDSPETPDDNINGLWLVTEIVDNIIPPDFVQRLTLSRAKFAK